MKLYTYWRSTAAYRVRIGLNLKGLNVEMCPVHLVRNGGEQKSEAYAAINPNRTVPSLVLEDDTAITQSLAILTYLDETHPDPALLPADPVERAKANAAAQIIACDVHPVNNLRIGAYLKSELGQTQDTLVAWMKHWMRTGLGAYQASLPTGTAFSHGDQPMLSDLCLIPQIYNARRWGLDLSEFDRLVAIEQACLALPAFRDAAPEAQPDAEQAA